MAQPNLLVPTLSLVGQMTQLVDTMAAERAENSHKLDVARKISRAYALRCDHWKRECEAAQAALEWVMKNCVDPNASIDTAHEDAIRKALIRDSQ